MKPILRLGCFALAGAMLAAPRPLLAGSLPLIEGAYEVSLDMDRDGREDRAVVARDAGSPGVDLYVYLGAGDERINLSRPPSALKKDITLQFVTGLEGRGNGALVVSYGCGGCSNDYETTLTIVWRGGRFVVAAFAYALGTRQAIGDCAIDFLTGTGFVSDGPDDDKRPMEGNFVPVTLADWSDDKAIEACGL